MKKLIPLCLFALPMLAQNPGNSVCSKVTNSATVGAILTATSTGNLPTCQWNPQFTYYVSQSTGNDSNPGTIQQPFQTIAHVNGLALTAGQSVGFKSGDSWREELVVPSSGSAGSPITFASYGAGAMPCLNCEPAGFFTATADVGNMSEWTSVSNTGSSTITADIAARYHGGPSIASQPAYGFDAASDGTNFAYASKTITGQSTMWLRFYVFVPPSFSQAANSNYTYIASLNSAGTVKCHLYLQQISAGNFQVHSQINFGSFTNIGGPTFTPGTWHRVDLEYVVNASTGGLQYWWDGTSQGSNFAQNSSGNVDTIQLGLISQNAPTNGAHLYFDTIKASQTSTVAGNTALDTNSQSHLVFNGLQIANSGDVGFYVHGGSTDIVLENSSVHDIDANTFKAAIFQNGASNTQYINNTIYNAEDGIAISGYLSVANSAANITGNTIFNHGRHGVQIAPAGGTAPTTTTVNSNTLAYCAQWVDDSVGILIDGAGAGNSASYNVSFNHGSAVYRGEDYDSDLFAQGNVWKYNVGYGSTNGCLIASGSGNAFYNNTCYNDNSQGTFADGEISLYTNASNMVFENNILYASSGQPVFNVQSGSTTGHTINHNVWFGGGATPFNWGGTTYNFANYQAVSGQDANSVFSDPLFTNASSANFILLPGSPANQTGLCIGGVTPCPTNIGAK